MASSPTFLPPDGVSLYRREGALPTLKSGASASWCWINKSWWASNHACSKLTPSKVLDCLYEIDHDIFATNFEMKSILKDEGLKHSVDEGGILHPTANVLSMWPVESRTYSLTVSWERPGKGEVILIHTKKEEKWSIHSAASHSALIYD